MRALALASSVSKSPLPCAVVVPLGPLVRVFRARMWFEGHEFQLWICSALQLAKFWSAQPLSMESRPVVGSAWHVDSSSKHPRTEADVAGAGVPASKKCRPAAEHPSWPREDATVGEKSRPAAERPSWPRQGATVCVAALPIAKEEKQHKGGHDDDSSDSDSDNWIRALMMENVNAPSTQ